MRRLQIFSFKKSFYERPDQKWICGRACLGEPCLPGPDPNGACQATCECRPLKKGDRWHCTRPTSQGGPCTAGPLPEGRCSRALPTCQPLRSLRAWRGFAALMAVAATSSALILVLTTKVGQAILSPGDLSFQHSSYKSQCSDCHPDVNSDARPIAWFYSAAASGDPLANSRLCLKCHRLGPQSFAAHALPSLRLGALTRHALQVNRPGARPLPLRLSSMLGVAPKNPESGWACATCHVEHQGKRHDLTRLSDTQCQGCHAVAFASLSDGHPSFGDYPFRRRTRIIFDHRSHLQVHFKEEAVTNVAPASCSACHGPDPKGSAMVVKSFDEVCAACHLGAIKGKGRPGPPGIAVIRVPGLDVQTLASHGIVIGDWPETAEGPITPFMELLLVPPRDTNAAPPRLAGVDFLDLSKASAATINEAANLAWSVKELIYDLSTQGHAGLEERLKAVWKGELSTSQTEAVAGLLSADVIQAARAKWFPNLAAEIARHRDGKKLVPLVLTNSTPAGDRAAESKLKPEDWVARGGWYRSGAEDAILYRPTGHADSFLRSWLDLTVAAPEAQKLFDALSDSKAPGLCLKCHSVDAQPRPQVNWLPYQPDAFEHRFTRFSHVAHFSLLDDHGCQTCHRLDADAARDSYAAAFDKGHRDPAVFRSNYLPIDRVLCAACHTRKYAGDSCLECHNYHIGHFMPTLPRQQWAGPTSTSIRR